MSHKRQKDTISRARAHKRQQFGSREPAPTGRTGPLVGKLLVVTISLVLLYLIFGGTKRSGGSGQDFAVPVSEVSDEQAKFYSQPLRDGTEVSFFVIKSSDGIIRAAFNACDVCYRARKGYRQQGDDMVCNKCGQHFPSIRVNEVKGGCNPAPLDRTVEGDRLVIRASALEQGAMYF